MEKDFDCPICWNLMDSPFSTKCGHSFCHECIFHHLELSQRCPSCTEALGTEDIFPNFALQSALAKMSQVKAESTPTSQTDSITTINQQINKLESKKRSLAKDSAIACKSMVKSFLNKMKADLQMRLEQIQSEISLVNLGLETLNISIEEEAKEEENTEIEEASADQTSSGESQATKLKEITVPEHCPQKLKISTTVGKRVHEKNESIFTTHAKDLMSLYLGKPSTLTNFGNEANVSTDKLKPSRSPATSSFTKTIRLLTDSQRLKEISTVSMGDMAGSTNIISSIEFDYSSRIFATAGVSKKIRLFEYKDTITNKHSINYPSLEIQNTSKISCISWNSFLRNAFAASDYDGVIQVYDACTGQGSHRFDGHEKRSWTVSFSPTNPTMLASGSDDCYVKLWSMRDKRCTQTIDAQANVCSVAHHPHKSNIIAFGSADHTVKLYDLRQSGRALEVLRGHFKAVSYVKFCEGDASIVSASTDCTLRHWTPTSSESAISGEISQESSSSFPPSYQLTRKHTGHMNEKNFVGLSVLDDNFYACGSETNTVHVYHGDLTMPLTSFRFPSTCPLTHQPLNPDSPQFISSLCWRRPTADDPRRLLIAANSLGNVKILELC